MLSFPLFALLASAITATPTPSHPRNLNQQHVKGKSFQQWGFLIMENTDYSTAESNPTFQKIQNINNNRLLSNYLAVAHPSLPNYIASIAGSTFGILDDRSPTTYNFSTTTHTVLDLLEAGGVSWRMYAENYAGHCSTAATNGAPHSYAAKHVPALYFQGITTDPSRCVNVVPASRFQADFDNGRLPQWWYYVPNLENDGHDTNTSYVASYLEQEWMPRFENPAFTKDLAMVLTYDESETYDAPNHVYAALIGDAVTPAAGHRDQTVYNHWSLIKTVTENWGLGNLGRNDTAATAIKI